MSVRCEFELIQKIKEILGSKAAGVLVGIGDDCAVVEPPPGKLLATVDALVEGVHFDLRYSDARSLGHKALAVNLSDIAAMGGEPAYALVSLGISESLDNEFILEFFRGVKALAETFGVTVIGGNLSRAPKFFVDLTLLGGAATGWLERGGARTGDLIAMTGSLGASAAGLALLRKLEKEALKPYAPLVQRHLAPDPRVREGQALQASGVVTSLIDISDGLASELHHLAEKSGKGFIIQEKLIPISALTREAFTLVGQSPLDGSLFGGEDYELLFTFPPEHRAQFSDFTVIGEVTDVAGVALVRENGKREGLPARGWNHFGA